MKLLLLTSSFRAEIINGIEFNVWCGSQIFLKAPLIAEGNLQPPRDSGSTDIRMMGIQGRIIQLACWVQSQGG